MGKRPTDTQLFEAGGGESELTSKGGKGTTKAEEAEDFVSGLKG